MEKKKILYLITKATWGGAQRYVYDLATHLPKNEFETVLAYGEDGKLVRDLKIAGIATYQIASLQRDVALFSDIASFFGILTCIRTIKPDVIHLNSSKAAALGALAARLYGVKKIIFTVHGWPFGEKRNIFSKVLIWEISWLTSLLSHRVICVSDYDLRAAERMPFISGKAVCIYNGIDLNMVFDSGEKIRSTFPTGAKIIGTIGELTKNKNQTRLIEKAKNNPDMYVAVVGEGEDRTMLEQKINAYGLGNRVKLFGFVPAHEALKGFDTFALPSIKEGLPYTLLEAKAAGLSIEANRVGGVGEILDKPLSDFSLDRMIKQTVRFY